MKRLYKLITILLTALLFAGCQVGLGEIVDMSPPTVNVNSPDRQGYILETITIEGRATDNLAVESLTLDIESIPDVNNASAKVYKFKIEENKWKKFNEETGKWEDYESVDTKIEGNQKDLRWYLTYDLTSDPTLNLTTGTEFTITTQVYDSYKNDGKNSKDERLVTLDTNEPNVTIISPSVRKSYKSEEDEHEKYNLKDNSVLMNLLNGEFTISGSQKEDCQLDRLVIYLDEGTNTIPFKDSKKPLSDELKASVKFTDTITGSNLRNWNTQVNLSNIPGYENNKKIVRLITESHDRAGNIETKVQGWFTYWNDADIPWVNASFGGDAYASNLEDNVSVYPSCALQGQAYDDDGLKSIEIKVYKEEETIPYKTEFIDLTTENYPKYKAWSVNALGETCRFRVEIQCIDKNNHPSEIVKRYMKVTDANPPKISITTNTKETMLGDSLGKVNFKGVITDDGSIKSVKLIRVKSGLDPSLLIPLFNPNDENWKNATDGGEEISCGKIWIIPLDPENITNNIHTKSFSKEFNIFTDFGIDGKTEKLSTQTFIIMATDVGGSSKIDTFTWAGDIKAPELSFSTVNVKKSDNKVESINFAEFNSLKKQKKLSPFENGDTIEIAGTWKDNSTEVWSDKTKKGSLILKWNEELINVKVKDDGTWSTGYIIPKQSTTAALSAELSDYAGNTTKINESFFVSSNNPELIRISSKENDGSYKAGTEITIILEFNKAVGFYDGAGNPTLTLNVPKGTNETKREAICTTRTDINGKIELKTEHEFKYPIQSGDDIDNLDVIAINTNGTVWKDVDGLEVKNPGLPSEENRLSQTRSIVIDTKAPTFTSIKAITPAGSYNKGKEIFIQADLSEEVVINDEDIKNLKLNLNAKSGLTTTKALKTGPKTILFTYTIGENENTNALNVTGIAFTSNSIQDTAGNNLTDTTVPVLSGINTIRIDTAEVTAPTISGINYNDFFYDNKNISFTINGIVEDVKSIEYSLDDGKNWKTYVKGTSVKVEDDGEYYLTARQTDTAGNVSDITKVNVTQQNGTTTKETIKFNIDNGNILTSVTAGIPTGTYSTGTTIPLYLNFRKAVVVSGASLTLNLSNGKEAVYTASGSTATKAKFEYTIQDGDSSDGLNVESITGTFKDEYGNDIGNYVKNIPEGKNLLDSKIIKIITGIPNLVNTNSVVLSADGTTLTISFDRIISKGRGKNITITQTPATYIAPAVLSTTQYDILKASIPTLDTYYEKSRNGSDEKGVSFNDEKYVLKYTYDTNDGTLCDLLKNANAHSVIIPVNSTFVSLDSTKKKLIVKLTGNYKLPVKGAEYSVSIPSDLVIDVKNHGNVANSSNKITLAGFEKPIIRIEKKKEKMEINGGTYSKITQPFQANVKIDCQTPGVDCYYIVREQKNEVVHLNQGELPATPVSCNNAKPKTITQDEIKKKSSDSKKYENSFKIGVNGVDSYNGAIYLIGAMVGKTTGTNTIWSTEVSYETAYKTVVAVTNNRNDATYKPFWIRGGDNTYGGVTASDFPFSWDSAEVDKVRAMSNNNGVYYWVTWSINQTAYFGFLNGDYTDDQLGPKEWIWGDCGIVPYKEKYPLLPGGSFMFYTLTNWGTWRYLNQDKKKESRTYNTTTQKWEVSKAGN